MRLLIAAAIAALIAGPFAMPAKSLAGSQKIVAIQSIDLSAKKKAVKKKKEKVEYMRSAAGPEPKAKKSKKKKKK